MNEGEADHLTAAEEAAVEGTLLFSLLSFVVFLTFFYSVKFSRVSRHQRVCFQLAGEGLRSRNVIDLHRSL